MDEQEPVADAQEVPKKRPSRVVYVVAGCYSRARRPDRGHMETLSRRVPYWFLVLMLTAIASFQIWMNPFGFSDLVQRYSQDIADLLIMGPHFYGTEGRDKVSVAMIDEGTLHELQTPWPWSYGDHARALGALLSYNPKAVVVDILFVDPRRDDTLPELIDVIHRYKQAHVPLYFEGGINLPYGENPITPEIAKTGVPILDPTTPVNAGVARQYNATGVCFNVKPDRDGNCPSLALKVYRDLYLKEPPAKINDMMEMVWGTKTAPSNLKWMMHEGKSCAPEMGAVRRIYLAFFDTGAVKSPCPYDTEIPLASLMAGGDDDIPKLIQDHVVFYGGDLQGAQDKVFTPVNNLISGVFVHAMALDNLITFHGKPEQDAISIGGQVQDGNLVQIIAVMPVILILSWFNWRSLKRKREHGERSATFEYFLEKTVENLWHYVAFALGLGIGLLLTLWAGLSVANWVEVVFVSAELAGLLLVGAPASFWGYLHHVAGGDPQIQGDFA
jgi:CHASE2 domain-containing sensor protein